MFGFKKALICLSVSMTLSFAVAAYANAEGSKTGVVKGDILNIRKSPSTSADILEQLEKGMSVTVVSSKDGWYKVSYKGITGWVSSEFVTVKQVSSQSATIKEDNVNLRENASTDSLVLRTFKKGTSVSVLSSSGNWYKVRTSDGKVGWVFSDFINANQLVPLLLVLQNQLQLKILHREVLTKISKEITPMTVRKQQQAILFLMSVKVLLLTQRSF